MAVTVLTWSVTVVKDVTRVGIHVVDDEEDDFDTVEVVATATADVVSEVCSRGTST